MTLGLNEGSSGGDFLPRVEYDARSGILTKVDRFQTGAGWDSEKTDITSPPPAFAIDFGSIEVGWIKFSVGAPDFRVTPYGQPVPPQPSADHKQGFRVRIYGKALGGIREFSSTAKCVIGVINKLHDLYEAAPEARAGQIPVVRYSGKTPVVTSGPSGKSTNWAPTLDVIAWTNRVEAMGERTVPIPTGAVQTPLPIPPQPAVAPRAAAPQAVHPAAAAAAPPPLGGGADAAAPMPWDDVPAAHTAPAAARVTEPAGMPDW
jgi:hypothetical protein